MWVRVINSAAGRRASWRAVGLIPRLRNGRLGLRVDAHDVGAELAVASRGGVGLRRASIFDQPNLWAAHSPALCKNDSTSARRQEDGRAHLLGELEGAQLLVEVLELHR